ncbi:MAG: energy transducer TonB [Myroides sp.]|jgi:hypothetical protein|nr:energy transducer TonB [Myroides sp.]
MPITTRTKLLISALTLSSFLLGEVEVVAKESTNNIEQQQAVNKTPAKYPGHFMNDFVKGFYKQFKNTNSEESELTFTINFTVTDSGVIENITMPGISDPNIIDESTTLVKSLKKWKPATEEGKAVAARYSVPFYINLSDVKSGNAKPVYYAKKEDSLFQQASYPSGVQGFWKEFYQKHGPMDTANFLGDRVKFAITVTIEKDGTLTNPEINGIESKKHQEAFVKDFMDVISRLKNWYPAMYDGKPVRSKITIPFVFKVSVLEEG